MKKSLTLLITAFALCYMAQAQSAGNTFGTYLSGMKGVDLGRDANGMVNIHNSSGRTITAVSLKAETASGKTLPFMVYMMNGPLADGDSNHSLLFRDIKVGPNAADLVTYLSVDAAISDAGEFWGPDSLHRFAEIRAHFKAIKDAANNVQSADIDPAHIFLGKEVTKNLAMLSGADHDKLKNRLVNLPELHSVLVAFSTNFATPTPWDQTEFFGMVGPSYPYYYQTPNVGQIAHCFYPQLGTDVAFQFTEYSCPYNLTQYNMTSNRVDLGSTPGAHYLDNEGQASYFFPGGSFPVYSWSFYADCDTAPNGQLINWSYFGCPVTGPYPPGHA